MRPMSSKIVAVRRRVPKRLRSAALRLLGREPEEPAEQEQVLDLAIPPGLGAAPAAPQRTLTVRTPVRTYVSHLLAESGLAGYEPDTLACFLAAIEERGFAPVFDVGANIGVFSWLAAALTPAVVVAFEPTPDLAAQMRAICAENDLHVTVEELALGAAPGTAEAPSVGQDRQLQLAPRRVPAVAPVRVGAGRHGRRLRGADRGDTRRPQGRHGIDRARRPPRGGRRPGGQPAVDHLRGPRQPDRGRPDGDPRAARLLVVSDRRARAAGSAARHRGRSRRTPT